MNIVIKLLAINIGLTLGYLAYLCILDFLFVHIMNEEKSFLNTLPLLVFSMPFLAAFISGMNLSQISGSFTKVAIVGIIFVVMSGLAFIELLWVSTHFHTMIGGKV